VAAIHRRRCHFDLLHQFAFVGIHRIEAIDLMMLVRVRSRIPQGAKWIHLVESFLASSFKAAIDALRLINNDDGTGRANQVNRLLAARLLAVLVQIIYVLLVDGPDGDDHHLNVLAGGEVSDLPQLR
jgi:hypothetical protein